MEKKLKVTECGIPELDVSLKKLKSKNRVTPFDLSSHKRAREAIDFGMKMRAPDFNIFVIGKGRTRRILGTSQYVQSYLDQMSPAPDWVYLNNFQQENRPKHFAFPAGTSKEFKKSIFYTIQKIQDTLLNSFSGQTFSKRLEKEQKAVESFVQKNLNEVRSFARDCNLDLQQTEDGTVVILAETDDSKFCPVEDLPFEAVEKLSPTLNKIQKSLMELNEAATIEEEKLMDRLEDLKRQKAASSINPYMRRLHKAYDKVPGIKDWLKEMQEDILENLSIMTNINPDYAEATADFIEKRYAVNVLVSNDSSKGPKVLLEPNPSYENLFGSIKYHTTATGGFETDFTMIEAGSLHRANGGVLILRAEDLVNHEHSWRFLKAALRDREIRIEELHRIAGVPMLAAPAPAPIPLNIQIILIGSLHWYYSFFYNDEDFQNYFKIKADMDDNIPVTSKNIGVVALYLQESSERKLGMKCDRAALSYVAGYGCRLAGHRKKISVQLDVLMDILKEASVFAKRKNNKTIKKKHILQALDARQYRNSHFQDLEQEYLKEDLILIQTKNKAVGQINGLTVQTAGTETFGSPVRITARTYMGRHGIVNIEHMVELGGPIQHKGVLSLEGFLRGVFGQDFPISFSCTITFEQNYDGVEGDSASVAELMAILSSLSGIPLRQDIAITGSMNQMGMTQPIGGVSDKIEGFYYTCKRQGLTGTQGVIIPKTNVMDVILMPEISEAVKNEKFHIWAVDNVFEAVEILTGKESGCHLFEKPEGHDTVFGKAYQKLQRFDTELQKRFLDLALEK